MEEITKEEKDFMQKKAVNWWANECGNKIFCLLAYNEATKQNVSSPSDEDILKIYCLEILKKPR
jgi:hypothetical protein